MLHDNGRGFDPETVVEPAVVHMEVQPPPEDLRVGGLGIHFMRRLMDEVHYQFDKTEGNTLTMVKYIEPAAMAERPPIWQEQVTTDIWLVGINGRLDHSLIPQLDDILSQALDNGRYRILIDFTNVSYINSGGLRCLVSAWRRARTQKGDVVLFGLNDHVLKVFTMAGFDNVFHIYPSRLEAQTALQ
jgi:anti-sigma B factor antagonist